MTEWPTVDQVIADWAEGVGCVAEPSPTLHPSIPTPDVVNVPGTPYQVIRRADATFDVWDGYRWVSQGHDTLSAAYAAALDLPRGASRETAGVERRCGYTAAPPVDPRLWRGIAYALVPSLIIWAGIIWCVWRFA